MDPLETALDDLDGLLEAYRALADDSRSSDLRRSPDGLKQLQREEGMWGNDWGLCVVFACRVPRLS